MKKILAFFTLITTISTVATAKDTNVYVKFGADLNSRFSSTSIRETEEGEYDPIEYGIGFPRKGNVAFSLALEATKNISPNFEAGFGVAYTHRGSKNQKIINGYGRGSDGGEITRTLDYASFKAPLYDSFPLYLTLKYNFNLESDFKPYVKADLGYSFNKVKSTYRIEQSVWNSNENTEKREPADDYDVKVKAKNGLYMGVGLGVEYKNFVTELSYIETSAKLNTIIPSDLDGEYNETYKYKNKAIRLSVGYKFNF